MVENVSTFEHCAKILAPSTYSKALFYRRERAFRKALELTKSYEHALLLCNWAHTHKEKERAYTLMVRLTPVDASEGHLKELIHDYGILQKISWIAKDAHRHLLTLRPNLRPDDQRADTFIEKLAIIDYSASYGQFH